jgi:glutathione S-transferase
MRRTAFGPAIARFLDDPDIVEVMLNPDGRLWIDRLSSGLTNTGQRLSASDGERIVRLVAHHVGAEVHAGAPRVSAELPETGERFEGLLPPVVAAPVFAIRKPAGRRRQRVRRERYVRVSRDESQRLGPTIEDGDFMLWESNVIVRYLAHKTESCTLCPSDIRRRFDAERWMDWQATTFWAGLRPLLIQLIRTPAERRDAGVIATAERSSLNSARILDAHLADQSYLAGDEFSNADIPAATTAYRWFTLDIARPKLSKLERWYGRMTEREHFRDVVMKPLS